MTSKKGKIAFLIGGIIVLVALIVGFFALITDISHYDDDASSSRQEQRVIGKDNKEGKAVKKNVRKYFKILTGVSPQNIEVLREPQKDKTVVVGVTQKAPKLSVKVIIHFSNKELKSSEQLKNNEYIKNNTLKYELDLPYWPASSNKHDQENNNPKYIWGMADALGYSKTIHQFDDKDAFSDYFIKDKASADPKIGFRNTTVKNDYWNKQDMRSLIQSEQNIKTPADMSAFLLKQPDSTKFYMNIFWSMDRPLSADESYQFIQTHLDTSRVAPTTMIVLSFPDNSDVNYLWNENSLKSFDEMNHADDKSILHDQ